MASLDFSTTQKRSLEKLMVPTKESWPSTKLLGFLAKILTPAWFRKLPRLCSYLAKLWIVELEDVQHNHSQ